MILRRLPLLAALAAAQFVFFEAALRWHGGSEASPAFQRLFRPDPYIGHVLAPGVTTRFSTAEFSTTIAINPQGIRDDEPVGPKRPDERRIVVLGDSIVFAVQVEHHETFCERLEARLNARGDGLRYRVLNAGVQGYGPIEALRFLERVGAGFEPDLVLFVSFVANDAVEALDRAKQIARSESMGGYVAGEVDRRLKRTVRRSMVLQILAQRARVVLERFRPSGPASPDRRLLSYSTPIPDDVKDGFRLAADAVRDMTGIAAAHGASLAIALVPARFQLDPAEYGRMRDVVEPAGYRLEIDGASKRFAEAYGRLGLPMIDLLDAFRRSGAPERIFFRQTVHLTPYGHRVAADALAEFLDRHGLP
ncbi:MAG TPA: GDSL-type esterase/lipase family protein [Vicinamibacterales bacterium]